jgi:homoserine kinase
MTIHWTQLVALGIGVAAILALVFTGHADNIAAVVAGVTGFVAILSKSPVDVLNVEKK